MASTPAAHQGQGPGGQGEIMCCYPAVLLLLISRHCSVISGNGIPGSLVLMLL
jgi:hypothetical protein